HPNVVRLFDLGSDGPLVFLTMELIDGPSLKQRLVGGALPPRLGVDLARQIALGLAAAHEAGIVHRDLKPGNVLLEGGDRAVVADFGVATEQHGSDASAVVGTSLYMAPEQANGEAATPQADLYSLGLLIHEMLTASIPLCGSGPV